MIMYTGIVATLYSTLVLKNIKKKLWQFYIVCFVRLKKTQGGRRRDGLEAAGRGVDVLKATTAAACLRHLLNQAMQLRMKHLPSKRSKVHECQTVPGASPWDAASHWAPQYHPVHLELNFVLIFTFFFPLQEYKNEWCSSYMYFFFCFHWVSYPDNGTAFPESRKWSVN